MDCVGHGGPRKSLGAPFEPRQNRMEDFPYLVGIRVCTVRQSFCLLGWTHDAMNAFGDRTSEFAAVAQALRSKGLKPLKHRKENVYTARMETNRLAAEISKDTHATAQKLEVLTKRT